MQQNLKLWNISLLLLSKKFYVPFMWQPKRNEIIWNFVFDSFQLSEGSSSLYAKEIKNCFRLKQYAFSETITTAPATNIKCYQRKNYSKGHKKDSTISN